MGMFDSSEGKKKKKKLVVVVSLDIVFILTGMQNGPINDCNDK